MSYVSTAKFLRDRVVAPSVRLSVVNVTLLVNRFSGFVRRGVRSGFCSADVTDIQEIVDDVEDKLVSKLHNNLSHVFSTVFT